MTKYTELQPSTANLLNLCEWESNKHKSDLCSCTKYKVQLQMITHFQGLGAYKSSVTAENALGNDFKMKEWEPSTARCGSLTHQCFKSLCFCAADFPDPVFFAGHVGNSTVIGGRESLKRGPLVLSLLPRNHCCFRRLAA